MDRLKFWKSDDLGLDSPQASPQEYDLGAKQFDTPNSLTSANPLATPLSQEGGFHDPLQHTDPFAATSQGNDQQFRLTTPQYPQAQPFPGSAAFQQQQTQQYQDHYPQQYAQESVHPREVELILAKLDSIKSELDALHQRVKKIEQYYDASTQQKKYW